MCDSPGTQKIGKCSLYPHIFTHPDFSLCLANKLQMCFHRSPQLTVALSALIPTQFRLSSPLAARGMPRETTVLISTFDCMCHAGCMYLHLKVTHQQVMSLQTRNACKFDTSENMTSFGASDFVKTSLIHWQFAFPRMAIWNGKWKDVPRLCCKTSERSGPVDRQVS